MEECCGINLEQEMTIENLYCFIRASLQALQSTGGYGEADFVVIAVPTNYDSRKNFLAHQRWNP